MGLGVSATAISLQWLPHTGEAPVAQSTVLGTSEALILVHKLEGFLESHQSLVHAGILEMLVLISEKEQQQQQQ